MNAGLLVHNLIAAIKETNGDIIGVFVFSLMILHFVMIDNKTYFELFLLVVSIAGLIWDGRIVALWILSKYK